MKRSSINTRQQSTEHNPALPPATAEGTSKNPLTTQTGAAGLPLSSSSLASLVATEVARHSADFESKLRAETEATIAREVKAKVAEILDARSATEQFTEDEAPTAKTLWAMDTFAHALGKFVQKKDANKAAKKLDPKNYPSLTIMKVKQDQVFFC